MARSRTAGPAMTSPAAMAAASAPAAGGTSRSRRGTAGCAGCRPASPPRAAAGLAGARGWNDRIIAETSRALAVVLAGCQPGDMIAWSQLPAALHRRDLSITRTAEILGLAGLLHDDRVPSFTALAQPRLALLPPPMAAGVRDW